MYVVSCIMWFLFFPQMDTKEKGKRQKDLDTYKLFPPMTIQPGLV